MGKRKYELFPYQKIGAEWLASKKTACLFDEQRLGKAVQSVSAIDIIDARTVLVVAKGVARANWKEEFCRWSKRSWNFTVVYSGDFDFVWSEAGNNCVIVSYDLLPEVLDRLGTKSFDCAIIDESHSVKSHDAKRTRAVFGKGGVPQKARRVWCLTGTPTPNALPSELWTTLFTFGATKLSYWDFAKRFCIVKDTGYGTVISGTNKDPTRLAELREIMGKKILRREARDVAVQLPKMSFSTVMVEPGKVSLGETSFWKYVIPMDRTAELNEIVQNELGILNGILADKTLSGELLETLKAQSKSISTLRRYTALQKLEPACELIAQELENGAYQKCVIFAHHRDCILGAAQRLYKFHPVTMYGGTSPARLERNLKNFQNPKHKTRVFIGQTLAAGTSISLSAANHIFFLEEEWVPGDNAQAAMRCGGVNQPNPVFVRNFCLNNSSDQRVQEVLRQKTSEQALIYGRPQSPQPTYDLPGDMI